MCRLFALLVILSAVGGAQRPTPHKTSPPPRNGTEQQQSPDNKANLSDSAESTTLTPSESQPSSPKKEDQTQAEPECIFIKILTWELLPHWLLFFAAVWAGIIALRTLGAIEDEAKKITEVAKAANLNAQAVINSSRPWVIIFAKRSHGLLTVAAGNVGTTPAEIISYSCRVEFMESLDKLPILPQFGTKQVPQINILVPNPRREHDGSEMDLLVHDPPRIKDTDFTRKIGWEDDRGNICVLYFQVIYRTFGRRDTSIPDYETRTCFWYSRESTVPAVGGPKEYNEHS